MFVCCAVVCLQPSCVIQTHSYTCLNMQHIWDVMCLIRRLLHVHRIDGYASLSPFFTLSPSHHYILPPPSSLSPSHHYILPPPSSLSPSHHYIPSTLLSVTFPSLYPSSTLLSVTFPPPSCQALVTCPIQSAELKPQRKIWHELAW